MLTRRPRGTNDILPEECVAWQLMEETAGQICREFGYQEIRTPLFEHTELFTRSAGETSDIVIKEMYSFDDRSGRSLTLRPEGTAPTVRAFLEHKMHALAQPIKLYYLGPMFRYGRPQAGRYRQFHQFGVEVMGAETPVADAEVIILAMEYYRRLGLTNLELHLNSVGCLTCRPQYRNALQAYLEPYKGSLCLTCQNRLPKNPLRIFDCKTPECSKVLSKAPLIRDSLCSSCREHFRQVKDFLTDSDEKYMENDRLVRGLDYYTRTTFEVVAPDIGAQSSIGGGGRYDGLIELFGGPALPATGFGLGLERTLLALRKQNVDLQKPVFNQVYIAAIGKEQIKKKAFLIVLDFRRAGIHAEMDFINRSLKAQLKYADKQLYKIVVFIGESELAKGVAVYKDMKSGKQHEIPLDILVKATAELLKEEERSKIFG